MHPAGDRLRDLGEVAQLALGTERSPLLFCGGAYEQVNPHKPELVWNNENGC